MDSAVEVLTVHCTLLLNHNTAFDTGSSFAGVKPECQLFMTSNGCIPVKNEMGLNATVSCVCTFCYVLRV